MVGSICQVLTWALGTREQHLQGAALSRLLLKEEKLFCFLVQCMSALDSWRVGGALQVLGQLPTQGSEGGFTTMLSMFLSKGTHFKVKRLSRGHTLNSSV